MINNNFLKFNALSLNISQFQGFISKPYYYYQLLPNSILVYFLIIFLSLYSPFSFSEDPVVNSDLSLTEKLDEFFSFFTTGIYGFFNELLGEMAAWYLIWVIKAKIFFAQVGFDAANIILENFGISDLINNAFSSLDSKIAGFIFFLRIPEAINIILSAYIARMVLDLANA
jgi:hypothetical protein